MSLNPAIVRIRDTDGRVVGAGFLVGQRQVLTCAHVIDAALGRPRNTPEMPQADVHLDFPLVAPDQQLTARVISWQPSQPDGSGDVAGLELTDDPPAQASPVRLVKAEEPWGHSFRAFGFPQGHDGGTWTSGVIRGRTANDWLQIEDTNVTGYRVQPGFSGGAVWDEQLDGVVGMVTVADRQPEVRAAFIIPTDRLVAAWPQLATWTIPPCPYRGLLPFREQDAPFFFGREEFAKQLVKAVREHTMTIVEGSSGSGKSSVVFAGLLPHLRQAGDWLVATFRPEDDPFKALAAACMPLLEPEMSSTRRMAESNNLADLLVKGEVSLNDIVRDIKSKHSDLHLLLIVDQFEELYTLCPESDTRHSFLDCLLQTISQSTSLHLILTLRIDFMEQACGYRPFADALNQARRLMLGPMAYEELEMAIARPAEQEGIAFEGGLVARILDDVASEPGSLPLLEFALTQLWKQQKSWELTHAAYEDMDKIQGALTNYASDIYADLDEIEKEQAQLIFLQLVRPGEGTENTRRPATRADLEGIDWNLVKKLADKRLLVTSQNPMKQEKVEVAHEALIREWDLFRDWVQEHRSFLLWRQEIEGRVQKWVSSGNSLETRDKAPLLRGSELETAQKWLETDDTILQQQERDFIQAGIALREQEQVEETKHKKTSRVWIAASIIALIVISFLVQQRYVVNQAARARALSDRAIQVYEEDNLTGIRLAMEALAIASSSDPGYEFVVNSARGIVGQLQFDDVERIIPNTTDGDLLYFVQQFPLWLPA